MNDLKIINVINSMENITLLSDISMSDSGLPVYPVSTSLGTSPDRKAILKILTKEQAAHYQHLMSVSNPYLEKIYDVGFVDDIYYSVNEFIPRPDCFNYNLYNASSSLSLYEYIQNFEMFEKFGDGLHFLDEKRALSLILELIEGLEAMNAEGFVHGDLSPTNILLTDKDKQLIKSSNNFSLKIIDFGTIRAFKPDDHPVTQVVGTKEFVAPEILAYNIPNDRIDIYSLGCILHYMCLGISPTEKGLDYAAALLSPGVLNIIRTCTNEYSTRYRTLKQLKKAVLHEIRIPADTTDKFMSKLPGFRTNKLWKKIIASLYYLWLIAYIFYCIVFLDFRFHTWLFIGLCVAWVIFVCDAFNIGSRILWYTNLTKKHRFIRYIVKSLIFVLLFMIYWILWYVR